MELLTFSAQYTKADLEKSADAIVELVKAVDCHRVMIGGLPAFMPVLEATLVKAGIAVGYARSERVSEDHVQPDGSVKKVATFKHAGLYWSSVLMNACIYCSRSDCIAYTHGESICG